AGGEVFLPRGNSGGGIPKRSASPPALRQRGSVQPRSFSGSGAVRPLTKRSCDPSTNPNPPKNQKPKIGEHPRIDDTGLADVRTDFVHLTVEEGLCPLNTGVILMGDFREPLAIPIGLQLFSFNVAAAVTTL